MYIVEITDKFGIVDIVGYCETEKEAKKFCKKSNKYTDKKEFNFSYWRILKAC